MMENWKSPRAIEQERLDAIEAERQRQFKLFDDLADLVNDGVITIEQLKEAFATPSDGLYIPGGQIER